MIDKRGKIKLLISVSILVFIGMFFFLSAVTSNTKEYDDINKIITIKDSSGKVLSDITLNTPLNLRVPRGYQKVAEFTIDNKITSQPISSVLEKLDFYDVKDGMKKFDRQFDYRYEKNLGFKTVNDYETVCVDGKDLGNGTIVQDCSQVLTGMHQEEMFEWTDLSSLGEIPTGETKIGIFTEVKKGDRVEWIPTFLGIEINEWATWTEDLNVGLMAYYSLDESSGTNAQNNATPHDNNGTLTNGAVIGQDGKLGNGVTFDGTNDHIAMAGLVRPSSVSACAWYYPISYANTNHVVIGADDRQAGNKNRSFYFSVSQVEDAKIHFVIRASGVTNLASTHGIPLNVWTHACVTYTSGNMSVYVNGKLNASSGDRTGSMDPGTGFAIGHMSDEDTDFNSIFNGTIDEVGIWNRSLSQSEITDLWNGGSGMTYTDVFDTIPPETTKPTITPSPANSSQDLNCNATLTDAEQTNLTAFWKWYKNNASDLSGNTSVTNGTNTIITTLSSGNTTKGEEWKCGIIPNDEIQNGTAKNSSFVTILNSIPIHSNPTLTTSSGKNLSTENLNCANQSTSDADNDIIVNVYNWYKNSQPLTVLNLPFENNSNDYSGNNNDGNISGAIFTSGKLGQALSFDGVDDTVSVELSNFPNSEFTFEMWFNVSEFSSNGRDLFTKYSGGDGFRTLITSSGQIESAWDINDTFNTLTSTGITANTWHHFVVTYNGSLLALYLDGNLKDNETDSGNLTVGIDTLTIGFNDLGTPNFNGSIDEVRIYNRALTQEQISNNFNLNYNTTVSQETTAGETYQCQVTPNDGEADGATLNSTSLEVLWGIEFNVTDSFSNESLDFVTISCNSTGFNQNDDPTPNTNTYGPYGFSPGTYSCEFEKIISHFTKTITFTAESDKVVNVFMSESGFLSQQEHTWLEAIYNCLYSGDCSLYNLLLEVNQTVSNIWEQTKPTDESVVLNETITNKIVNSTQNLTIDYSVYIPIKAGYSLGAYLPVRIGFWFMDETNTTCYNQGDRPTGVSDPYCQPLIVETLGPMGGSVNFTVELQPSLVNGSNYSIKRIIDIDPLGVWYNYGKETIGTFLVAETLTESGVSLETTGEVMPSSNNNNPESPSNSESSSGGGTTTIIKEIIKFVSQNEEESQIPSEDDTIYLNQPGITGGVIGGGLLSSWGFVIIVGMFTLMFITIIISRIVLRLKGK